MNTYARYDSENYLDKSCRENENTHFVFSNFYLQIVPFMR
jgi:hypothetical protein